MQTACQPDPLQSASPSAARTKCHADTRLSAETFGLAEHAMASFSLPPVARWDGAISAIFICLLTACSDAPTLLSSQRIDSPDARRSAVVEELDNGLGFGLGALILEVHVVGAREQVRTHGEASRSTVFYANVSEYKGSPITVHWLSNNRLRVTYGQTLTPGRRTPHLGEVSVEYVAL